MQRAKEEWLKKKCAEIGRLHIKIRELTRQEVVESHNRQYLEGTWHTKEE